VPTAAFLIYASKIPLGPVAVFGASIFHWRFLVAGGDYGFCIGALLGPVNRKSAFGQSGYVGTVGRAIQAGGQEVGLPEAYFRLLFGRRYRMLLCVSRPSIY